MEMLVPIDRIMMTRMPPYVMMLFLLQGPFVNIHQPLTRLIEKLLSAIPQFKRSIEALGELRQRLLREYS
jgi:hypothetical protein